MYVSREKEWEAIQTVCFKLEKYTSITPEKAVVAMVSPDYSATAAMHVAHHLSLEGEMLDIIPVDVPYPDEDPTTYFEKFILNTVPLFKPFDTVVLVEAGVITGGNYTFMVNHLVEQGFKVVTVALFENVHSRFKCDVVGSYYDSSNKELEFYYERENKHW